MKKIYYFLSGLPRSGSTVLASILNQNPHVYVTPTSPLLNLIRKNFEAWHSLPEVIANPFPEQLTNITKAMIDAAWQHRPEEIIIDKHRGWGKNMTASTVLFEKEVKVIYTVRDLPSIMASWLTLLRKNPNNLVDKTIQSRGRKVDDEARMIEIWLNMGRESMECVQQLKKDAGNRLLEITYDDLVSNPANQLKKVESFLNLPMFNYDYDNVINEHVDDDLAAFGIENMHKIRPKVEKTSRPAIEILGETLYNKFIDLEKEYE